MKAKLFLFTKFYAWLVVATISSPCAFAQGTALTYQGRLNDGANPANGNYDLRFTVYDSATNGSIISGPLTNDPTAASNGLFTVTLDFGGGVFTGPARWLEIGVRTNGSPATYSTLLPRQPLTATPYAITAGNVTGAVPAAQLTGTVPSNVFAGAYSSSVTLSNPGNSFTGSGAGLSNLPAWRLSGNSGTTPGVNFLGTTDNQPLELFVNGQQALRLEPNASGVNFIGGASDNTVTAGNFGAAIGGGGRNQIQTFSSDATIGGGLQNLIATNSALSTIGGGDENLILNDSSGSTISGGADGQIGPNTTISTIGGGSGNQIQTQASYATISGGAANQIQAYDNESVIAGGIYNVIGTGAAGSTISGGGANQIQSNAFYSTISGGVHNVVTGVGSSIGSGGNDGFTTAGNTNAGNAAVIGGGLGNAIEPGADYSTIGGGQFGTIQPDATNSTIGGGAHNVASGSYGTVPGGDQNVATNHAFAAGHRAKADDQGSFVWADSTDVDFSDTGSNTFNVRASGGVTFTSAGGGANQTVSWSPGSGSWSFTSDRNAKENFEPVDVQQALEKVARLPLMEWNYKGYGDRHVGPMAQDFHAAFPFNPNDKMLNSADEAGVTLAAIQGLNQKLAETRAENAALKQRLDKLEQLVNSMNTTVK